MARTGEKLDEKIPSPSDFCCGIDFEFNPAPIDCSGGEGCTILPYHDYYADFADEYKYCAECFNQQGRAISRTDFSHLPKKNDRREKEPVVNCAVCGLKFHKICVLYFEKLWREFKCNRCFAFENLKRCNPYSVRSLPHNNLSEYLERKVNSYLETQEKAPSIGFVSIRVVVCDSRKAKIFDNLKNHRKRNGFDFIEGYPFRYKAVVAIQEIDGKEVAFFSFITQEYGSACPSPNRGCVYLAYLDSVQFFRPREMRTAVYYQILLGYFEYVKELGFENVHIWACPPPSSGIDYIFYAHPPTQKIPKAARLQDWYNKLLKLGKSKGIIYKFQNLVDYLIENKVTAPTEIPYFEGDHWPKRIEELLTESRSPPLKKRKQKRKNAAEMYGTNLDYTMQAILKEIYDQRKSFIVAQLNTARMANDFLDVDVPVSCPIINSRDDFMAFAQANHYEFASLRRAKFSTMAILYELHNAIGVGDVITCNECREEVGTLSFYCASCSDFDLCIKCYQKEYKHPHPLVLQSNSNVRDANQKSKQISAIENYSFESLIESSIALEILQHAKFCRGRSCRYYDVGLCALGNQLALHLSGCRNEKNSRYSCIICLAVAEIYLSHADHCNKGEKCRITICPKIRMSSRKEALSTDLPCFNRCEIKMDIVNNNVIKSRTAMPVAISV